jgi:hypothetical protein
MKDRVGSPVDIDIALDDQFGSEFAGKVVAWMENIGEGDAVRGSATISKNPSKSKHLETATMNIHGFSIGTNAHTDLICCFVSCNQV